MQTKTLRVCGSRHHVDTDSRSIEERQRLLEMVKSHRDRTRAPSEPAGKIIITHHEPWLTFAELIESVTQTLRYKVSLLAEDNWMYEAEDDHSANSHN